MQSPRFINPFPFGIRKRAGIRGGVGDSTDNFGFQISPTALTDSYGNQIRPLMTGGYGAYDSAGDLVATYDSHGLLTSSPPTPPVSVQLLSTTPPGAPIPNTITPGDDFDSSGYLITTNADGTFTTEDENGNPVATYDASGNFLNDGAESVDINPAQSSAGLVLSSSNSAASGSAQTTTVPPSITVPVSTTAIAAPPASTENYTGLLIFAAVVVGAIVLTRK